MALDFDSEVGQRAARRLQDDQIAWLTTVRADLSPFPVPVWFLWDGETILVYSQPNHKVRNIGRNSNVAINLNSDDRGGNVVILTGVARIEPDAPPASEVPAYREKYAAGITGIGLDPEGFARSYNVAIRITPTALRSY